MKHETLTFSDLKRGQKFVVLPGEGWSRKRDGDWRKANYLFVKSAVPNGNAIRICDKHPCRIPDFAPVIRVKDSGRAAGRRRRR